MEIKEWKDKQKKGDKRKGVHLLELIMPEEKKGKGISMCSAQRASNTSPPQISSCMNTVGFVINRACITPHFARHSESAIRSKDRNSFAICHSIKCIYIRSTWQR